MTRLLSWAARVFLPRLRPVTKPTSVFGVVPGWNALETSFPFSVTATAWLWSSVICTSTSPPLTRSACVDSVLMSRTLAAAPVMPNVEHSAKPTASTIVRVLEDGQLARTECAVSESALGATRNRSNSFMKSSCGLKSYALRYLGGMRTVDFEGTGGRKHCNLWAIIRSRGDGWGFAKGL